MSSPEPQNQLPPLHIATSKSTIVGKLQDYAFVATLFWIIALVMLFRGTVLEPFKIPSGSMIPTLQISDQILVTKLSYGLRLPFVTYSLFQYATPKRGDVVVFTRPDEVRTPDEDESAINLIKRVIGLPGETVEVRGMQVFINGAPLNEPYARWSEGGRADGDFGPRKIPEGRIFLLGDNRDQSRDSRFWEDPFLEVGRVKGRALFIYWTFDRDFFARIGKVIR